MSVGKVRNGLCHHILRKILSKKIVILNLNFTPHVVKNRPQYENFSISAVENAVTRVVVVLFLILVANLTGFRLNRKSMQSARGIRSSAILEPRCLTDKSLKPTQI